MAKPTLKGIDDATATTIVRLDWMLGDGMEGRHPTVKQGDLHIWKRCGGVRAFVVVRKWGNAHGAKERRNVDIL